MKKTFSFSLFVLFFITVIFLLTTCSKDYSYEGGPVISTSTSKSFTLLGAGSTCTGPVLSGNYNVGIALTATNTVQLSVHVDSIGNYTISTSSVDGFQFTGSGSFTDTGFQTIVLQGVGTPTADGNFTFTAPQGLGCTFTVPVTKQPAAITKYILEGSPTLCSSINLAGSFTIGYKLNATNYAEVLVNVLSIGSYSITTGVVDGISFSASGTFTKVGLQTVQLIGNGTPLTANYVTFTPLGDSSSCNFTVPIFNAGPLATYVLESVAGNPNPCTYTVAGNYVANTPLAAANTVAINVYVTVLGNFTVATNTINGMSFYYTGNFTSLGTQQVVSVGNGTPAASGTFSFMPQIVGPAPLGGSSCGFNVTVQ